MRAAYKDAFGKNPDVHHWAFLCWIRDDYQAALAAATAETQRQRARADAAIEWANSSVAERTPQQAGRWEPVEDGDYEWSDEGPVVGLTVEGVLVLSEGYAICRRWQEGE